MKTKVGARGFTLLEILVVIVIIGVMMSLATLALRDDPERRLETEAQRFAGLLRLASQEAVLQSREFAIEFEDGGYRFLMFDNGEWVQSGDNVFRGRSLPEDMELDLEIDGERLEFGTSEEKKRPPRIYLLSGGEATPFRLTFGYRERDSEYRLDGDFAGRLTFDEDD